MIAFCFFAALCVVGFSAVGATEHPPPPEVSIIKPCVDKEGTDHSKCGILYWDNSTWAKEANKQLDFYEHETYKLLLEGKTDELAQIYAEYGILAIEGYNSTIGRDLIAEQLPRYADIAKIIFQDPKPYYREATSDLEYLIHKSVFYNANAKSAGTFYQLYRRINGTEPVKYELLVDSFAPFIGVATKF